LVARSGDHPATSTPVWATLHSARHGRDHRGGRTRQDDIGLLRGGHDVDRTRSDDRHGFVERPVSPWQPTNPFQDITVADMELAQKLARTGAYRDDPRSPEWFGYALAGRLNLAVSYKGANDPKDLFLGGGIDDRLPVDDRGNSHRTVAD
jgi:hypothetical protein